MVVGRGNLFLFLVFCVLACAPSIFCSLVRSFVPGKEDSNVYVVCCVASGAGEGGNGIGYSCADVQGTRESP